MRTFSRPPPLRLDIGEDTFRLGTPDEFELSLRARIDVRSMKLAQFSVMTPGALSEEERGIERLERVLLEVLTADAAAPGGVGRFLKRFNLDLITLDQSWRDILGALARAEPVFEDYKRVAIQQYLDYLGQRREAIGGIADRRRRHSERHDEPARRRALGVPGAVPMPVKMPVPEVLRGPGRAEDGEPARQRLSFELADLAMPFRRGTEFGRMPKGLAISVEFEAGCSVEIMLATYKFVLVAGRPMRLVDDCGFDLRITPGRAVVGRGGRGGVLVSEFYPVVSRQHLVIEDGEGAAVRLTDVSSFGTFLPVELLYNTG